jgi:hypothetical protein
VPPKNQATPPARIPVTFQVGSHVVRVSGREGVWSVDVDGTTWPNSFGTAADAWEAGVREADRLDRQGKA